MPSILKENKAQEQFDLIYITGHEIMEKMQISRVALMNARKTGKLPEPINIHNGHLFIWERAQIKSYLEAWKIILLARRKK